jgi:hypothetical protein
MYAWVSQVVSFPQVSPLKPCMHLKYIYIIITILNPKTYFNAVFYFKHSFLCDIEKLCNIVQF